MTVDPNYTPPRVPRRPAPRTAWTSETAPRGQPKRPCPYPVGSVKKIFSHIICKKPHVVGKAIMRGLTGPNSFPFVQLMAAYIDGKPVERVLVSGTARMLFLPTRPMLGLPPAEGEDLSVIDADSEPRGDED